MVERRFFSFFFPFEGTGSTEFAHPRTDLKKGGGDP